MLGVTTVTLTLSSLSFIFQSTLPMLGATVKNGENIQNNPVFHKKIKNDSSLYLYKQ